MYLLYTSREVLILRINVVIVIDIVLYADELSILANSREELHYKLHLSKAFETSNNSK